MTRRDHHEHAPCQITAKSEGLALNLEMLEEHFAVKKKKEKKPKKKKQEARKKSGGGAANPIVKANILDGDR